MSRVVEISKAWKETHRMIVGLYTANTIVEYEEWNAITIKDTVLPSGNYQVPPANLLPERRLTKIELLR